MGQNCNGFESAPGERGEGLRTSAGRPREVLNPARARGAHPLRPRPLDCDAVRQGRNDRGGLVRLVLASFRLSCIMTCPRGRCSTVRDPKNWYKPLEGQPQDRGRVFACVGAKLISLGGNTTSACVSTRRCCASSRSFTRRCIRTSTRRRGSTRGARHTNHALCAVAHALNHAVPAHRLLVHLSVIVRKGMVRTVHVGKV